MKDDSKSLFGELFETPRRKVVPVLVPMPAPTAYSYAVPDGLTIEPGAIVQVPLGPRQVVGVVWDGGDETSVDPKKLRGDHEDLRLPAARQGHAHLPRLGGRLYLVPTCYVARMALLAPAAFDPEPMIEGLALCRVPAREDDAGATEGAGDGIGWSFLDQEWPCPCQRCLDERHRRSSSNRACSNKSSCRRRRWLRLPILTTRRTGSPVRRRRPPKRSSISLRKGGFAVSLIDGVTGSGKTEVYFEAIAETLKQGKQVLILLPEIALTANFLERSRIAFGSKPGEWHSDLATRTRVKRSGARWQPVRSASWPVHVSALPALRELGLIIVDEEHDPPSSRKTASSIQCARHGRRPGAHCGLPGRAGLGTPSVESQVNCIAGRYTRIHLPTRFADAAMPDLHLIDMRRAPPERGGFLSPVLLRSVGKAVERANRHFASS